MKFFIFFALAFATALAKDVYYRSIDDPVPENEGRVTNGLIAAAAQFKYQVGLSLSEHSVEYTCSGSLLAEEWVLSAAHCTVGVKSAKVYLGATQLSHPEKCYDIEPKDIINHPIYNPSTLGNDISVIKIPTTKASSLIGFVRLPNHDDKYLNHTVVISGWGNTSDNCPDDTNDLHYGIMKVSPGIICFKHFGADFSDDLKICVATPHKVAACEGDSGGPLVLVGQNLQIGVFSFYHRHGCASKLPNVYTRVSAYKLWIGLRTGIHS